MFAIEVAAVFDGESYSGEGAVVSVDDERIAGVGPRGTALSCEVTRFEGCTLLPWQTPRPPSPKRSSASPSAASPSEAALTTATSAATACGLPTKGRLLAGFDADLLIVQGNPTAEITRLRTVQALYLQGNRVNFL